MATCRRRRPSQRGSHQLASPNMCIATGQVGGDPGGGRAKVHGFLPKCRAVHDVGDGGVRLPRWDCSSGPGGAERAGAVPDVSRLPLRSQVVRFPTSIMSGRLGTGVWAALLSP